VNKKLSCQDIVELVTDYIENALRADEHREFEHHLRYCPGCVTYVDQIRKTIRVTRQLPREEPLAPALRARLVSQFPSSHPHESALLHAQEHKGYGADEGEREELLEREGDDEPGTLDLSRHGGA
jgi:anti-sigma factor RsiW